MLEPWVGKTRHRVSERACGWAQGVFGLGYGAFMAIDFAMLMDVLPNKHDAAKVIMCAAHPHQQCGMHAADPHQQCRMHLIPTSSVECIFKFLLVQSCK